VCIKSINTRADAFYAHIYSINRKIRIDIIFQNLIFNTDIQCACGVPHPHRKHFECARGNQKVLAGVARPSRIHLPI
jgi:hypothetical protein